MSEKKNLFPVLLVMAPFLILGIVFPLPAKSQGDGPRVIRMNDQDGDGRLSRDEF